MTKILQFIDGAFVEPASGNYFDDIDPAVGAPYALVPDDRAFACFPLNRLGELLRVGGDGVNTAVSLFDSIRVGTLPGRSENAYLVIG